MQLYVQVLDVNHEISNQLPNFHKVFEKKAISNSLLTLLCAWLNGVIFLTTNNYARWTGIRIQHLLMSPVTCTKL